MTGRSLFNIGLPALRLLSVIIRIFPEFFAKQLWVISMPFNGFLAKSLRYSILNVYASKIGKNVSIGSNTMIKNWKNFECGSNVSIHEFCHIDSIGGIKIGNNVSIAHHCSLVSFEHSWSDIDNPIKYNNLIFKKIQIEDDIWIGCRAVILGGSTIDKRSIIAAGAVVKKRVFSNSIVGGVPAKLIKKI